MTSTATFSADDQLTGQRRPSILVQLRQLEEMKELLAEREEEILECVNVGERLLDKLHERDLLVRDLRGRLGEGGECDASEEPFSPIAQKSYATFSQLLPELLPRLQGLEKAEGYIDQNAMKDTSFACIAELNSTQHPQGNWGGAHRQLLGLLEEMQGMVSNDEERETQNMNAMMSTTSSLRQSSLGSTADGDALKQRRAALGTRLENFNTSQLLTTVLQVANILHEECTERDAEIQHLKRLCNNNSDRVAAARALEELAEARAGLDQQEAALNEEKDNLSWCQRETLQQNAREVAQLSLQIGQVEDDLSDARCASVQRDVQLSESLARVDIQTTAHTLTIDHATLFLKRLVSHTVEESDALNAATTELTRTQDSLNDARRKIEQDATQINALLATITSKEGGLGVAESRTAELNAQIAQLMEALDKRCEELTEASTASAKLTTESDKLRNQVHRLEAVLTQERTERNTTHETLLRTLEQELSRLGEQLELLTEERDAKATRILVLESVVRQGEASELNLQHEAAELQERIVALNDDNSVLSSKLTSCTERLADLDSAQRENEQKDTAISELRAIVATYTQRVALLEKDAEKQTLRHQSIIDVLNRADPFVMRALDVNDLCEIGAVEKIEMLIQIAQDKANADGRHGAMSAALVQSQKGLQQATTLLEEAQRAQRDAEAGCELAEGKAEALRGQLASRDEACSELAALRSSNADLERTAHSATADVATLQESLTRAQRSYHETEALLEEQTLAGKKLAADLAEAGNALVQAEVHTALLVDQVQRTQTLLEQRDAKCFNLETTVQHIESEITSLTSQYNAVSVLTEESQKRCAILEEKNLDLEKHNTELVEEADAQRRLVKAREADPLVAKMLLRADAFKNLEVTKQDYAEKLHAYQTSVNSLVEKNERDKDEVEERVSPLGLGMAVSRTVADPMQGKFARLQSQLARLDMDLQDSQTIHKQAESEMLRSSTLLKQHLDHSKSRLASAGSRGYSTRLLTDRSPSIAP